ncbi:FecR family protein [Pedobacter psychrodurus]|uniref:FecR family protein n=1 Tax=Pedobacter psychrodurus TaxID=2530456 RepID=A0A4R0Q4B2_9SPHI|nr:FecR family protein [Pedobacter psychrodurus]TCD28518.1 FecR family protein [Pedobacter psychrodurus]
MNEKEIAEMLERYKNGEATAQEEALLLSWSLTYREEGKEVLSMEEREHEVDQIWNKLDKDIFRTKRIRIWPRIAAAAVLLISISIGLYLYTNNKSGIQLSSNDIQPGQNSATLTLSNGKKIKLNSAANGQLMGDSGISISKTADGQLVYTVTEADERNASSQQNMLETYKGEQYQVILPDGSHVWLNAASTLKYPLVFSAKERLVELSGEAYFEVAHNPGKPFRVKTTSQQVEVLGTHFNINAYPDDLLSRTTLLSGSIRVSTPSLGRKENGEIVLSPGEQTVLVGNKISVVQADPEEAIAWKNGYFMFKSENIRSVMKKVSRWYDVEIVYKGEVPDDKFGGVVSRFSNVTQVLRKLELTEKVHFEIEGRRIIVTK